MNKSDTELNQFQLRNIELLTKLYADNAIDDDIVELLRKSELDYFSLLNKYNLLEKKINIDEKTNLLKFKPGYLTEIIKTASRIYYGSQNDRFPVTLIRFDIDDFSSFNNQHGHDCGDKALISFANLLRENSRPTDYVIRFGGEEFDVLLPSTDLSGAKKYLDNIYNKMQSLKFKHMSCILSLTASAGASMLVYSFTEKTTSTNYINDLYFQLQQEADNALYEAKYLGKNRYSIYDKNKKNEYTKIRKLYVK